MSQTYKGAFLTYKKDSKKVKNVYVKFTKQMTESQARLWIGLLKRNHCLPYLLDEMDHTKIDVEVRLS
jgi:hypothetical protein